ncbi:hypothetical protein [Tenacibaculum sp.]|uniref:hypothetical protein n=1 Tax=Tenacibaculum sp. TaxID=1906242 RepID=UPI003D097B6E
MKKQILNLGKALNKANQKQIIGGSFSSCDTYSGPICYGIRNGVCGSCADYNALPPEYKMCALVHSDCINGIEPL